MHAFFTYVRFSAFVGCLIVLSIIYGFAFGGIAYGVYGGALLSFLLTAGAITAVRNSNWKAKIATSAAVSTVMVFVIWITRYGGTDIRMVSPDGSIESTAARRFGEFVAFFILLAVASLIVPQSRKSENRKSTVGVEA